MAFWETAAETSTLSLLRTSDGAAENPGRPKLWMLREAAFLLPPMCRAVPRWWNTLETVKIKVSAMGSVIFCLGEKSLGGRQVFEFVVVLLF